MEKIFKKIFNEKNVHLRYKIQNFYAILEKNWRNLGRILRKFVKVFGTAGRTSSPTGSTTCKIQF